ncbi:serine/threonine-protein kinase PEPKR2-like [Selaginella moellendorffii]|nr:serine/threonine-protein kinase PEPKR2-like [Selaginella moellendorffii]|eukprot:XP_024528793.1 serine/threonine-protein kinase PEPKR2-like [Selaginella moellendorffii]
MACAATVVMPEWVTAHYDVLRELGRGAYGGVFELREKSRWIKKKKVACKILDVEREKSQSHEAAIMKKLHNLHGVVCLKKAHCDSTCSCMVMELCECDLVTAMATGVIEYDKIQIAQHFRHLVKTIKAMHHAGIVHRDLKPENVLVTKKRELKVGDFGTAVEIEKGGKLHEVTGTWNYMAPEMIFQGSYDERVDVYALGLILYFMLELKAPEDRKIDFQQCPAAAMDLINKMIDNDPAKRITLDEALRHPFLQHHHKGY